MGQTAYELPKLGYAYDALQPAVSAEVMELHHNRHHQAYVDGANQAREDLAQAVQDGALEHVKPLSRNLAFNLSGHVLHSLFWRNIAPDENSGGPEENLAQQIRNSFGNLDALRESFQALGAGLQGSGWAALSWDPLSRGLMLEQIGNHQDQRAGQAVPLLVMDMWEHAYYLQYRNDKKRWIEAFWKLINWKDVSGRLAVQQALAA